MTRPSRTVSLALFAAVAAAFVLAPFAGAAAATAGTAAASCAITTDDLAAIRAAAAQGLLAELAARRALLTRIITCAQNDAQALQDELNGLPGVPSGAQPIQSQLAGKLGDAATYYGLELAKVPVAGIAGTQEIAAEVLAWRTSNYEPLADNVQNFELWVSTQPLLAAASDRLNGVANLVSYFEQAGANNELSADLSTAQALVETAKNDNQSAENAFAASLPPDQVRAMIQQTLRALSDAYEQFFNIAGAIQALLPSAK